MALIDLNGLGYFKGKENAMIAGTYSASSTYAVGDYVYYAGTLYRCTTAITTAEAWTAAHWTAAKLANDVGELKSSTDSIDEALTEYIPSSNAIQELTSASSLAINGQTGAIVSLSGWKITYFPIKAKEVVTLTVAFSANSTSVFSFSENVPSNGGESTVIKWESSSTSGYSATYTAQKNGYILISSTNITVTVTGTIDKPAEHLYDVVNPMKIELEPFVTITDNIPNPTEVLGIAINGQTGAIVSLGGWKVAYFGIKNGQTVTANVRFGTATTSVFGFSKNIPASGGSSTVIKWVSTASTEYDAQYTATEDGYIVIGGTNYTLTVTGTLQYVKESLADVTNDLDSRVEDLEVYDGINPFVETYSHWSEDHTVNQVSPFTYDNLPSGGHNWTTPSVVVTNSKKILVAADARMGTGADSDEQIVYLRKYENADLSDDSPSMDAVFSASDKAYVNISFVVDRTGAHGTEGRIYMFALKFDSGSYCYHQTSDKIDCVYKYSDDDGDTWSAETSIKTSWDTTSYVGAGTSPDNGKQLSDGTLILPAMFVAEYGVWGSGVIYKKPSGSWTFSKMTPNSGDNECSVYEDSSNNVFLSCRTMKTEDNVYKYDITNNKWIEQEINYSTDVALQRSIISKQYGTVYQFGTPYILFRTFVDPSSLNNRNFMTLWMSKDGTKWIRLYQFYVGNNGGYGVIDSYSNLSVIAFMGTGGVALQNVSSVIENTGLISNTLNVIDGSSKFRIQMMLERILGGATIVPIT